MKKSIILIICLFVGSGLFAQEKMYIHKSDKMTLGAPVSATDSIFFSEDQSTALFRIGDTLATYPVDAIDSITFGDNMNTVYLTWLGTEVSVINPLAFEGVSVSIDGAYAIVHSSGVNQEVYYHLSGSTTEGTFKLYSDQDCQLQLNGIDITNPVGPAVNIQSTHMTSIQILDGTSNIVTDGPDYEDPPAGEDQDGPFFSEGMMEFAGMGTLTVHGLGSGKHGLCSDDYIEIDGGHIIVTGAAKDGIHADEGLLITGGTIEVTSSGDGIDGDGGSVGISGGTVTVNIPSDDVKGIASDEEMLVSGGTITITVDGDQSKGMKCDSPITLNGGEITIYTNGDAVLEESGQGYDPSYCTAIKGEDDVIISGAEITIVCTGLANKGISADGDLVMSDGNVQVSSSSDGDTYVNEDGELDAYVSTCLTADGDLSITGGTVITSSSGSAGKGLSADMCTYFGTGTSSPDIQITTTGNSIYISGFGNDAKYAEAKAIKSDSTLVIESGNINISSADDGIKSEWAIDINGGIIDITTSVEGLEAPFITINDGEIHIFATDDCINTTFGFGGEEDDGSLLKVMGGYIAVSTSGGDGLDGNGDIAFEGGTMIVHGPPQQPEVGMDYNGDCEMNAGFLVISAVNSMMIQSPGNMSDQYSVRVTSGQMLSSGTLFHIEDASGNSILTFQPERNYSSIIFSSSDLQTGVNYRIYTGGTCTGTEQDGLYTGGTYSGGTFRQSFNITNTVTNVNF